MENFFFYLCEEIPRDIDFSVLFNLLLESIDFIKLELEKIKNGDDVDGVASI